MRYLVPALAALNPSDPATLPPEGGPLAPKFYIRREEEIRRSRFIATLGRAPDKESARLFIEAVRREFPDATHNCWAYVAGPPGDTSAIGQSDDGEPHGTAGRPMLNQLLHGGVGEVAAVISRYFGGVKLGTGGLARAYQAGVAEALALLPTEEKTRRLVAEVTLEYADYARAAALRRLLPDYQARLLGEEFAEKALFRLDVPDDRLEAFCRALSEATDGGARLSFPGAAPEKA